MYRRIRSRSRELARTRSAEAADELAATEMLQQFLAAALVASLEDGEQEALLRAEVVHHVRGADPGPLADVPQRAGAEAALGEDGAGGVDDGALGFPAGGVRPARAPAAGRGRRCRHSPLSRVTPLPFVSRAARDPSDQIVAMWRLDTSPASAAHLAATGQSEPVVHCAFNESAFRVAPQHADPFR